MSQARHFPIGLTMASAIALAILIGLGLWQVQRLGWKTELLAKIEASRTAAPAPLADLVRAARAGEDVSYRRVRGVCAGLDTAPYIELHALKDGVVGARLISACALPDGAGYTTILVDRGYVAETISARPPQTPSENPVEVEGVLRAPDDRSVFAAPDDPVGGRFYTRDVHPIAAALKAADPAPVMLMAETSSNPQWLALQPMPVPVDISNRHLEYALTWFGLAGALACVYAALLWRRIKGQ